MFLNHQAGASAASGELKQTKKRKSEGLKWKKGFKEACKTIGEVSQSMKQKANRWFCLQIVGASN